MSELTQVELVQLAHRYYPVGFPPEEDDYEEPLLAYQRTPEHQRWREAWEKALEWERWDDFLKELETSFHGYDAWDVTQPWMAACRRCCVYFKKPLPDGGRVVTRVAGAVSILAPLYLVYATVRTIRPDATSTRPRLIVAPTGEAKPEVDKLARHIEQSFGYRPFPLELADVPLPDIRVGFLYEQPTLMGALLAAREQLENLP